MPPLKKVNVFKSLLHQTLSSATSRLVFETLINDRDETRKRLLLNFRCKASQVFRDGRASKSADEKRSLSCVELFLESILAAKAICLKSRRTPNARFDRIWRPLSASGSAAAKVNNKRQAAFERDRKSGLVAISERRKEHDQPSEYKIQHIHLCPACSRSKSSSQGSLNVPSH
jgi:hypothetical protein